MQKFLVEANVFMQVEATDPEAAENIAASLLAEAAGEESAVLVTAHEEDEE